MTNLIRINTCRKTPAGNCRSSGGKLAPFEGGDRREGGGLAAYLAVALGELAGQMKGIAEADAGKPLTPMQDVCNTLQSIGEGQLNQRPSDRVLNYMELAELADLEFKAVAALAWGAAHADLDDTGCQLRDIEVAPRPVVDRAGIHRSGLLLSRLGGRQHVLNGHLTVGEVADAQIVLRRDADIAGHHLADHRSVHTKVCSECGLAPPFLLEPVLEKHGSSLVWTKRPCQAGAKPFVGTIPRAMRDEDRRRRFVEYFQRELRGDRARLMHKTGLTKGRVSQLFDSAQPFGEKAAASLAGKLGLPDDYFEGGMSFADLDAFEANLITAFRQLSPEDQRTLLINVNERVRAANTHPPMDEAERARGEVTFDREHKNATESDQWQSTKPITKTDVSTGRASPVLRDTEDKDHPKRQPARRKGERS